MVTGKRRSLVNFHSFRRWFTTKAERAGNRDTLIAAIVGHKRAGMTLGRYSEGPEMRQAKRCIASVKLPELNKGPVKEARALTPRRRNADGV
jgi:integrase